MEVVRFENEYFLYGLFIIPILALLFISVMLWRRNVMRRWGDDTLIKNLIIDRPRFKHQIKFFLLSMGIIFLILGMANLQFGSKLEKVKRKGVDIVIALDLSRSMQAEDVKPSRLERSKLFISKMLEKLVSDRIALVVFAGNAYLQMPLTTDYSAAKLFLNTLNTDIVPTQGTAIGEAIRTGMEAYDKNQEKYKTMVIISDGENHEGDALNAAEDAAKDNIVINTVGVGSSSGAPVPIYKNNIQSDFVRDKEGNVVVSKLNSMMLSEIAEKGGGHYYRLTNSTDELEALVNNIEGMEKREIDTKIYTDYDDKFQYFLGASLIFFVLEFMISERGSGWLSNIKLFNR